MLTLTECNSFSSISHEHEFCRDSFAIDVHANRYVIISGGYRKETILKSSLIYDTITGVKIHLPLPPVNNHIPICNGAVIDKYFYILDYSKAVHRILIEPPFSHQRWEVVGECQIRNNIWSIASDGKLIYIIDEDNNLVSFNPVTTTYTDLPTMSTKRHSYATALLDKKLYVIGGFRASSYLFSVDIFNIETRKWSKGADIPLLENNKSTMSLSMERIGGLVFANAVVVGKCILISGGIINSFRSSESFLVYNTLRQKWSISKVKFQTPCHSHKCVNIGNSRILIFGGKNMDGDALPFSVGSIDVTAFNIGNWYEIGHFILLRRLFEENRVKMCNDENFPSLTEHLMTISIDIFRHILLFLL